MFKNSKMQKAILKVKAFSDHVKEIPKPRQNRLILLNSSKLIKALG